MNAMNDSEREQYNDSASDRPENMPAKKQSNQDDEQFPGYPHYSSAEDIMHEPIGARKVSTDPDDINRDNAYMATGDRNSDEKPMSALEDEEETDDDVVIVPGTEADVTKEDLELLGPKDQDMDMGDDEMLRVKLDPIGETGDDLDVPGEDLMNEDEEALGQDDEENSYYSLGGERHEGLEEDNQQG